MAKNTSRRNALLIILAIAFAIGIICWAVYCGKKANKETFRHSVNGEGSSNEEFTVATIAFTDDLGDVLEDLKDKMVVHHSGGNPSSKHEKRMKKIISALQKGTTGLLGSVAMYKKTPNTKIQANLTKQLAEFSEQASNLEQKTAGVDSPALNLALERASEAINEAVMVLASLPAKPAPKHITPLPKPGKITNSAINILGALAQVVRTAISNYSASPSEANYDLVSSTMNSLSSQANKYASDSTIMNLPGMKNAMMDAETTIAAAGNVMMMNPPSGSGSKTGHSIPKMVGGAPGKMIPYPTHMGHQATDYQQLTSMYNVLNKALGVYYSNPSQTNYQTLKDVYTRFSKQLNENGLEYQKYHGNAQAYSNLMALLGSVQGAFAMKTGKEIISSEERNAMNQLTKYQEILNKALMMYMNKPNDATRKNLGNTIVSLTKKVVPLYTKYEDNKLFSGPIASFKNLYQAALNTVERN